MIVIWCGGAIISGVVDGIHTRTSISPTGKLGDKVLTRKLVDLGIQLRGRHIIIYKILSGN